MGRREYVGRERKSKQARKKQMKGVKIKIESRSIQGEKGQRETEQELWRRKETRAGGRGTKKSKGE